MNWGFASDTGPIVTPERNGYNGPEDHTAGKKKKSKQLFAAFYDPQITMDKFWEVFV